jgi:hypothetical protein
VFTQPENHLTNHLFATSTLKTQILRIIKGIGEGKELN